MVSGYNYMASHFHNWSEDKQFRAALYFLKKEKFSLKTSHKTRLCTLITSHNL